MREARAARVSASDCLVSLSSNGGHYAAASPLRLQQPRGSCRRQSTGPFCKIDGRGAVDFFKTRPPSGRGGGRIALKMSSSIAVEVVKYEQFELLMNGKPPSVTLVQPTATELSWPLRPPRHLKSAGRALWTGIVMQYRVRDAAGLALVTTAAEALDRIREAQAAIRMHGALVPDRYGALKQNPACFLERDARAGMLSALRALNLDLEPLRDRGRSTV